MEWLTTWFIFGSISFWALIGIETILLFLLTVGEDDIWLTPATVSLIAVLALLQFVGKVPVFQTIVENPKAAFGWAGLYVLAGVVWMVAKWYLFVKAKIRKYQQEVRDEFVRENNLKNGEEIPAILKPLMEKAIQDKLGYGSCEAPQVSEHKEQLFTWFAFWPASGIWTIINDPITRLFNSIYHQLRGALQAISDRVYRQLLVDAGKVK